MKVLHLNPSGCLGGAERVLLACLAALREDAEPSLLLTGDGPLAGRAAALGVPVDVLPLPPALARLGDSGLSGAGRAALAWRALAAAPAAAAYLRRLRRAVAARGPDVVHSHGIKTHLLARLARPPGVPVVWHLHDFYGARPLAGRLLRRARRGVAGAVAVSEAVARDAAAALPGLPVAVVPNVVDPDEFAPGPDAADLDALAGLPPAAAGTVRVGLVATYARWKGHDVFLDAAARLARAGPAARFYVVGGPVYRTGAQLTAEELRGRADALGLAGLVGFVGFQERPAAVYRALDVVVHASTRPEPFGLVIAEAMACGRAVVAARAGGAAELFAPGAEAVGVPPGDPAALAAAVAALAGDPGLRGRLGAAARAAAVRRFAPGRLGPQLRDAYARFVGVRPAPRSSPPPQFVS